MRLCGRVSRRFRGLLLLLVANVLGHVVVETDARAGREREPPRLVWLGVENRPTASTIERAILDELRSREPYRIVAPGGEPLDDRLFASDRARIARISDEGIDLLLKLNEKRAIPKLDEAINLFALHLRTAENHDQLHDALLAKAEALFQLGKQAAARDTLRALAVVSPKRVPTKKSHPQKLVELWEKTKAELGPAGSLRVETSDSSAVVLLDGTRIGSTPLGRTPVLPGRHILVIRWPTFVHTEELMVEPGAEIERTIARSGPGEATRATMFEVVTDRLGVEEAIARSKKVMEQANATAVLVGALDRTESGVTLTLGLHDATGEIDSAARIALDDADEASPAAIRALVAAVISEGGPTEREITPQGEVSPGKGVISKLYGPSPRGDTRVVMRSEPSTGIQPVVPEGKDEEFSIAPAGVPSIERTISVEAAVSDEDDDTGLTSRWWFWAALGAVLLGGAAAGSAFFLRPNAKSTRIDLVLRVERP